MAHATVEETLFYPSVTNDETRELLGDSVAEHRAMMRGLADLTKSNVEDDDFLETLAALKQQTGPQGSNTGGGPRPLPPPR